MGQTRFVLPLLTAILMLNGACHTNPPVPPQEESLDASAAKPELRMEKMKIQSFGLEGKEWELSAPIADGYQLRKQLHAHDVLITFFQKDRKSSDLTADEGIFRTKDAGSSLTKSSETIAAGGEITMGPGDFFLQGHVVAISTSGSKLLTDWLYYNQTTELITSTAPVRIISDDSVSDGVGLEATANFSNVKIFNQKVRIREKPSKKKI